MATLRHLCVSAVAGVLALILCSAHAAEKKSAKVECTPSEEKLVYDCRTNICMEEIEGI